ncbi:transcription cofactor vestigial-like protein 1 [Denticeps clupeoides]|uniref:transcription cofactor vestigial-like protein 1 n=1 Tax=Denticeps clupeoides TaxID=299321 RepID=UPI0010A2F6BF|nr:transcription cofactor vestigial-like protein 2 [Denticeps clupeoides]
MEESADKQVAAHTEDQTGRVVYTYFQGDISSMVDAHFSRALNKPKENFYKDTEYSHWTLQPQSWLGTSSGHSQTGRVEQPPTSPSLSPTIWAGSLELPPVMYPPRPSAELQYTNTWLGLLQSEEPKLSTVVVAPTKAELLPSWIAHASDISHNPGAEKKYLYWN